MDELAWADELDTLDRPEWAEIRLLAERALKIAEPIVTAV
jgi:hypothetical protein